MKPPAKLTHYGKNPRSKLTHLPGSESVLLGAHALFGCEDGGTAGSGHAVRTRDLLVRQHTQTINALRGHLAMFGVVAPPGPAHVGRLASALEDPALGLPDAVCELGGLLLEQIVGLDAKIAGLERGPRESTAG